MDPRTVFDHALGVLVVLGALVGLPRWLIRRERMEAEELTRQQARTAARTAEGRARVVAFKGLGVTVNDVPLIQLSLELEVLGRTHRFDARVMTDESVGVGKEIAVRFDPGDPRNHAFVDGEAYRPVPHTALALLDPE